MDNKEVHPLTVRLELIVLAGLQILLLSMTVFLTYDTFINEEPETKEISSSYKELALAGNQIASMNIVQHGLISQNNGEVFAKFEQPIPEKTEQQEEIEPEVVEVIPERVVVYDNMTMEELATKLNRSLNSTIAGKGYLFASKSIELGIDPYLALAIVLQETGCKWNCSYLVTNCNNVGGQKGGPSCAGGAYKSFNSLDEGIVGFLDNLYRNYYAYGLTDVYSIHKKYAQDPNWPQYVTNYINAIKAK